VLETYNGFGYRFQGLVSPYLWSFSNLYAKGKYVADNKFDPEAVSQQCGAGLILKSGKDSGAF
jgi:lysozyme family protein